MKKIISTLTVCLGTYALASSPVEAGIVQEGFAPGISFPANSEPLNVTLADIDSDGRLDVAVANFVDGVSILRNNSSPAGVQLQSPVFYNTAIGASDVKFADLDGDSKPDMVAVVAGGVSIFRNISSPGTIAFAPKSDFVFGRHSLPNGVAIEDFNGDGKSDLAFLNHDDSFMRVMMNVSVPGALTSSSFALAAQLFAGRPIDIVSGDFNGDGLPDIFTAADSGTFFLNGHRAVLIFRAL